MGRILHVDDSYNLPDYSLQSTTVTVENLSAAGYVIGGHKATNADGNYSLDVSNLVIKSGRDLGLQEDDSDGLIIGGSYFKGTNNVGSGGASPRTTGTINKVNVEVSGGSFASTLVGAGVADDYRKDDSGAGVPELELTVRESSIVITGGKFNTVGSMNKTSLGGVIIGGAVAYGSGATTYVDKSTLTLKGNSDSNITIGGRIIGASEALNGGNATHNESIVEIIGEEDSPLILSEGKALYVGGSNATVSDSLTLKIENAILGSANEDSKWGIYTGSRLSSAGTYEEGSSIVSVQKSSLSADLRGGANVSSNVKLTAGSTSIAVEDTFIAGYDNAGDTWPGRIFGTAYLEGDSSTVTYSSATLLINNVSGLTYDRDSGEITQNPGGRVYGGGQVYRSKKSILTVDSTSVTVKGEETALEEVYGGSVISGTVSSSDLSLVTVGNTSVTLESGVVSDYLVGGNNVNLVGGNNVNWFGQGVVGVLDDENGQYSYAGHKFNDGSTHVTLKGGGSESLVVVGANFVDYSSYIDQNSDRKAAMFGASTVDIEGGTAQFVIGGGHAVYGGTTQTGDPTDTAPESTLKGTSAINISGGELEYVVGAGAAFSYGETPQAMASVATQEGTSTISIRGGTAENVIGGGLVLNKGDASLTGASTINISGGTVGNVVGGGYIYGSDSTTQDSNKATVSSTKISISGGEIAGAIYAGGMKDEGALGDVSVTGDAQVVFLADIGFEGLVDGTKDTVEGTSSLIFGDAEHQYDSAFEGTFRNFDRVEAAQGSSVTFASITNDNVGEALALGGEGEINVTALKLSDGTLTIDGGTVSIDSIDVSESGKLSLDGGTLRSASDQLFTQSLGEAYEATNAGSLKDGLELRSGTLAVTDESYNLGYAASAASLVDAGNVTLVFTGDLINTTDGSVNTITVSQAQGEEVSNVVVYASAVLDAATDIDAAKDGLVIGDTVDSADAVYIEKDHLGVQSIRLAENFGYVTVQNGHALTLVGNGTDALITGGAEDATVNVDGILQFGVSGVASGGVLTQELNIGESGQLLVSEGQFELEKLTNEGSATVTAQLTVNRLSAGSGLIRVGNGDSAGSLIVKESRGGNHIFLDPVFTDGVGIEGASSLVYQESDVVDQIEVGRNSYAVIGTDSAEDFLSAWKLSGLTWGTEGITAAVYLDGPVSVTGALNVDGSLDDPTTLKNGTVIFASHSLLVANVSDLTGTLITADAITVDEDSRAVLTGVSAGTEYKLTSTAADGDMWTKENITSANALYTVDVVDADKNSVTFRQEKAEDVYAGLMQGTEIVNAAMAGKSGEAEYDYVNNLLTEISGDKALAAARFDAAMNPAGALGVYTNAHDRARDMKRAVRSEAGSSADSRLWVEAMGGRSSLNGISTGAQPLDLDIDYAGIILGGEGGVNEVRFGAAFMAGIGETDNDRAAAEDEFDYYGLSLYGQYSFGSVKVSADASATWLKSDLKVGGSAHAAADATTSVYSFGLTAARDFEIRGATVTPFVGADVYHISSDGFRTNHGVKVDEASATAVEFPIGAKIAAAFRTNGGAEIKPAFTLAVVPTAADREIDAKVNYAGAASNYRYTFADDVRISSDLSVAGSMGNFGFGLAAGYDWGNEERSAANVRGFLKYMF